MKLGTCLAEQVGVKAPGRAKIAIFLPFTMSSTLKVLGPTLQPLPSTSMNSCRVPSGSLSPTLIVISDSFVGKMNSGRGRGPPESRQRHARRHERAPQPAVHPAH